MPIWLLSLRSAVATTAVHMNTIHKPPFIHKFRASIPTQRSQNNVKSWLFFYENSKNFECWEGLSSNGPMYVQVKCKEIPNTEI